MTKVYLNNGELNAIDLRNGNNTHIPNDQFDISNNPQLTCVYVDDAVWSKENWLHIDESATYVETQQQCDEIGVNEEYLFKINIHTFPNPVNDTLYINNESQFENNKFQMGVYNILGEQILNYDLLKQEIDIIGFPAGIYLLKIQFNNQILTRKIVKL